MKLMIPEKRIDFGVVEGFSRSDSTKIILLEEKPYVCLENEKWIWIVGVGVIFKETIQQVPENFTDVEFYEID